MQVYYIFNYSKGFKNGFCFILLKKMNNVLVLPGQNMDNIKSLE